MAKDPDLAAHLREVLHEFPPVQHAFAYGSGVIAQPDLYRRDSGSKPMLDFIFAVDNPLDWHTSNLARNPRHYSLLGSLGPKAVTWNAERLGCGIHFNTAVWWRSHMIKYGVIGTQALYDDLQYWDTLYIAGRMQKPVLMLQDYANLPSARKTNLDAAMTLALLLLPDNFVLQDLYAKICGVSYIGDVRMGFAEDSRKVERIAAGSAEGMSLMYDKRLRGPIAARAKLTQSASGGWSQDPGLQSRVELISTLPYGVLRRLASATQAFSFRNVAEAPGAARRIAEATVNTGTHQELLRAAVAGIVRPSSRWGVLVTDVDMRQAWAGIFMAGGARSVSYVWQKLLKAQRAAPHAL